MLIDYEQEPEKITVTLIFEDKESQVSWSPQDMSLDDVKFMFMCSCESLCDTEFEILDLSGKAIDINSLTEFKNNSVFYIRKKKTNKYPKKKTQQKNGRIFQNRKRFYR